MNAIYNLQKQWRIVPSSWYSTYKIRETRYYYFSSSWISCCPRLNYKCQRMSKLIFADLFFQNLNSTTTTTTTTKQKFGLSWIFIYFPVLILVLQFYSNIFFYHLLSIILVAWLYGYTLHINCMLLIASLQTFYTFLLFSSRVACNLLIFS